MREPLLAILVCPDCRGELALTVYRTEAPAPPLAQQPGTGTEIVEGCLWCHRCARGYPVIDGIPRFVGGRILEETLRHFPDFVRLHGQTCAGRRSAVADDRGAFEELQRRTFRSFSYEWTRFPRMYAEWERNYQRYVSPPLSRTFFPGKLGLDAGCGIGRHLHYAARYGARMVGVDLGLATGVARRNNRDQPSVEIVQADLYRLPFREAAFDFIQSFGVLHHLPDPEGAFRGLLRYLKPDSLIMFYVYREMERRGPWQRAKHVLKEDVLRRTVRSWPLPFIRLLCLVLGAISRVLLNYPYRALRALRPASPLLARFSMRDYADYPFSVTVNDLFDWLATPRNQYYGKEDILGWCERAGLRDVQVLNHFGWRAFGWTPGQGSSEGRREGVAAQCAG